MITTSLTVNGNTGSSESHAVFLPVDGRIRTTAVLADGFTAGAPAAEELVRSLTREGIAVVRTGGVDADVVREVTRALASSHGSTTLLVGHGKAGARLLEASFDLPSVKAIVLLGVPAEPASVTRLASLRRPLLVMHAPMDQEVAVTDAAKILEAAHHPKSFVSLDKADHVLSNPDDARWVAQTVVTWAGRYIPQLPREEGHVHRATARIGRDRFRTEIIAGGHPVVADEPESIEGTDRGPTPFELLLAGLGGCTAITIRMYADRKAWPLDAVHVDVTHERVTPEASGCETASPGNVDLITTKVRLEGNLDDAQHARLMDIAEKCPVHKALKGTPCLRTVVDAAPRSTPA